ncbi:MAG: hypothetical protein IH626_04640 [Rhodospirillales bacterium]|nr:hypothetical protein [Rhodospirillales bacterium]
MANAIDFLSDQMRRQLTLEGHSGFRPVGLYVGPGANALEVAVVEARGEPPRSEVLNAWKVRRSGRAAPLLLVVLGPEKATICGASGEIPPVQSNINVGQAERLCREALAQPDRHAALRFLAQALPSLETTIPGLHNEGLVALHELTHGVPTRADWREAVDKARRAVGRDGHELLAALGYRTERLDNLTFLLRGGDRRTALAVLLDQSEAVETASGRFNAMSPVSYALTKADQENLPWVIIVQGNRLRLYPTSVGVGVGRRGRTATFLECQPALLSDDHLAYLWLLYSADALSPHGSLSDILEGSRRFAGDLAERLRDRIYDQVVPDLAAGIVAARGMKKASVEDLELAYQMALTVLFRLLFIAYAENRDLLPYRFNDAYRRRSLTQKAQELADIVGKDLPVAAGDNHWQEVAQLWQAVATGNPAWGVPAYNGGLFTADKTVSPVGAALAEIRLLNLAFEPVLRGLLLSETAEGGLGPVDFRSLGVREFGTIYEGLLESELAVADVDLAVNKEGSYLPAKARQTVVVHEGDVYLHDRSGARKSSGSYFTKSFAVEHLLDGALEPALQEHLGRLDRLDDAAAADSFFDFRVADIAMGSGHFLVAAVDRIERALTEYLSRRPLAGVRKELADLRAAALEQLDEIAEQTAIEDSQLLRRLIARRCIYGVDLNALSVQLARLSIWIHTFVPGLPLSLLDHNLVRGNALVGVGTVDEIRRKFEEAGTLLFEVDADNLLGQAEAPLKRLARLADASLKDIDAGRRAMEEARLAVGPTKALCDLIAAQPISDDPRVVGFQFERWEQERDRIQANPALRVAREALAGLHPFHFPIAFPEVFLGHRPGFDVILGNPPWQEATVEEHAFWARHFPGLRSLSQREQEDRKAALRRERPDLVGAFDAEDVEMKRLRRALSGGTYPGMGTGDPDLYKAFCWRFWHLVATTGGRIGVVLPRSALAAKGSTEFRLEAFRKSRNVTVTMLVNNRQWVFAGVHPQYSIGLNVFSRGVAAIDNVHLHGPFASLNAFVAGKERPPAIFSGKEVLGWNDTASLPLLPTEDSIDVFAQLRKAPRLDLNDGKSWRARPDRELDATNQKPLMDLDSTACPENFWPVYKGESFDIWNPDTGTYYAYADPDVVMDWLYQKRLNSAKRRQDSAHGEFPIGHLRDRATLPCHSVRIAFRDVSRATDSRTVRVALIPAQAFVVNTAPYLLWPRVRTGDQAFLLGVLSSIPLDWYARRFVETHLNFFVLNPFPIPRPDREDPLRQRVIALAGRLASPDERFADWARAVGVDCGPLPAAEKEDIIHELDAVVAHLYGLNERQLTHIFETFHEGWDCEERLRGVLLHFRAWAKRGRP